MVKPTPKFFEAAEATSITNSWNKINIRQIRLTQYTKDEFPIGKARLLYKK